MPGNLKTIRKNVERRSLNYEPDMYTTPYGSIVISALMLGNKDKTSADVNKKWRNYVRRSQKGQKIFPELSDKDFIDKMLELFELERPKDFPIAMVCSGFNVLFAPYDGEKLYALREDGFMAKTLELGKIYPIDFKETK